MQWSLFKCDSSQISQTIQNIFTDTFLPVLQMNLRNEITETTLICIVIGFNYVFYFRSTIVHRGFETSINGSHLSFLFL